MGKIYALVLVFVLLHLKEANAQNVGVGTAAPASKLSVNGNLAIGSGYATSTAPANGLAVEGNVGIGTLTPGQKLEVNGRIRLTSSQTELYQSGNRLHIRAEDVDGVAQFATYGLYLPRTGQPYNLYVSKSMQLGYNESDPVISYRNGALLFSADATERMRLTSGGNLGIGMTPVYKLDVNAASTTTIGINTNGYAQDMSGRLARNLISSYSWNIGTGTVSIFSANQTVATENEREWGDGPHGNRALLWKCVPSGDGNGDGGWNTNTFEINHAKTYRVSIWVKKTGDSDGTTYLGVYDNGVLRTDGVAQSNPYFWCGDLPQLDRWYLIVGYIYGSGDAANTTRGGIYDGVTGQRVVTFAGNGNCSTDFKFTTSSTQQQQRAYLYYNGNSTNRQYFWDPRFEEVNGHEPTIAALLGNAAASIGLSGTTNYVSKFTSSTTIGNSQIFDDGTNVGVGTASPSAKLHVNGGNIRLAQNAGESPFEIISYSNANSLWLLSPTATSTVVLGTGHDWDRSLNLQYTPGTVGTGGGDFVIGQISKNAGTFTHGLTRFYTNGAERVRIDVNGNVGIGATSLLTRLQINHTSSGGLTGTSAYGTIHLDQDAGNDGFTGITTTATSSGSQGGILFQGSGSYGSKIHFLTTDSYAAGMKNRMTLDHYGNLGIGTTAPGQKLDVAGNVKIDDNIMVEGNGSYRVYRNLASYSNNNSAAAGAFVITTQQPWNSACMMRFKIEGYFYDATSPFEMTIGGYMYVNNDFYNTGYINVGAKKLPVRFARNNTTNTVAIIIGNEGSSYPYPKISAVSFQQMYSGLNESYADGWTITQETSLSNFSYVVSVPDVTSLPSLGQGKATTSSSSEITLTGNNTGSFSLSSGAGWSTGTWQSTGVSLSKSITSGNDVLITLTARVEGDNYNRCVPSSAYFRITRGGTEIGRTALNMRASTSNPTYFYYYISTDLAMFYTDSGVSGSQTYSLEYWLANDNDYCTAESVQLGEYQLNIIEIKP